jgi:hypothetical protein
MLEMLLGYNATGLLIQIHINTMQEWMLPGWEKGRGHFAYEMVGWRSGDRRDAIYATRV